MELLISELEVVKKLNTSLKLQLENNTLYSEDLYDTLCDLEYEVNETMNLCPIIKKIFNRLYKMKKEKSIFNVWSFQGHVYFKFSDSREERPIHIKHPEDIDYYFNKES